jgi:hypothetical protein
MIPEYSTESFQCGSRCLSNPAIYERLAKGVKAAIESVVTWLYIAGVELIAPSGSGMIDAYESVPKQNQPSSIAEAIRVRL